MNVDIFIQIDILNDTGKCSSNQFIKIRLCQTFFKDLNQKHITCHKYWINYEWINKRPRHIFVLSIFIVSVVPKLFAKSFQICMKTGTNLCIQGIQKEIGDLQVKTFSDETNHIWQLVKPKTFKETRSFLLEFIY